MIGSDAEKSVASVASRRECRCARDHPAPPPLYRHCQRPETEPKGSVLVDQVRNEVLRITMNTTTKNEPTIFLPSGNDMYSSCTQSTESV